MSATVVRGIGRLVTNDEHLGVRRDAAMVLEGGLVQWVGASSAAPPGDDAIDVEGACVIPGFVDSHTHLVFAGDRSEEFAARATGAAYDPGGIRATVAATRAASTAELARLAAMRRAAAARAGTTTMECKSGYGLRVEDERRSCEVAGSVADVATFLGAHVVPEEFAEAPDDYVDLVTSAMLAACAPLARFVDVFCEAGAFDEGQARRVLAAGAAAGLRAKVHANQLGHGPGVCVAVEAGAVSADHCTYLTDGDVDLLASSQTVATLLPITEFQTRTPFADARRLLDAGATVALASNCNPGSGYSSSMHLAIALAVREMGLTPSEALAAATLGGARALALDDVGVLRVGASADLVVLDAPNEVHLAYRPGMDLVTAVWKAGERVR